MNGNMFNYETSTSYVDKMVEITYVHLLEKATPIVVGKIISCFSTYVEFKQNQEKGDDLIIRIQYIQIKKIIEIEDKRFES